MNSISLIEKLKSKVNETNDYISNTSSKQNNLLSISRDLNLKFTNFIESDVNEQKMANESIDKITKLKTRIDSCKNNINIIKEKIKKLKLKIS